jgi:peptidyl-prolyl cis-trans isomerase SDCCAG10
LYYAIYDKLAEHIYTHTHTHTHIYIYIYIFFPPLHRNFKLLSFGEEAEEDEEESCEANRKYSGRSKSTHDILNDPHLSAVPAVEMAEKTKEGHKRTLDASDSDPALSEDEAVYTGNNISDRER